MSALSKAIIADALYSEVKLTKADAKLIIDLFFDEIGLALEEGEHVKLSGYGNFILRDKSQRPGRNPKTGKATAVAERRVVTFRPGLKLKNKIDPR